MKVETFSGIILRVRVLQDFLTINNNGQWILHEVDPLLVTFHIKPLLLFLNGDIFNPGQLHLLEFLHWQWSLLYTIDVDLFPC